MIKSLKNKLVFEKPQFHYIFHSIYDEYDLVPFVQF